MISISRPTQFNWAYFSLSIAIGLAILVGDHTPQFFFGDSHSYLYTTIDNYYPSDRSWLYGFLIRPLIEATGYFRSILIAQVLIQALAIGLVGITVERLTASPAAAFAAVVMAAIDPLGIYNAHSALTDSVAASFFCALLCISALVGLGELKSRAWLLLAGVLTSTILLLRVAYLPVLLGLNLVVVVVSAARSQYIPILPSARNEYRLISITIFSGIVFPLFVNGIIFSQSLGYSYNSGTTRFLLGVIAPAIKTNHIQNAGLKLSDFQSLKTDSFALRNAQIHSQNGLFLTLQRENRELSSEAFDTKMKILQRTVISSNPVGVLNAIAHNAIEFANPSYVISAMGLGFNIRQNKFDEGFVEKYVNPFVRDKLTREMPTEVSPVQFYLMKSGVIVWASFLVCSFAPLLVFFAAQEQRHTIIVIAVAAFLYAASICLFSVELVPRYFAPSVTMAILVLVIGSQLLVKQENSNSSHNHVG